MPKIHIDMMMKCFVFKKNIQVLSEVVFKNTMAYIHVALEHKQPTPITKLFLGFTHLVMKQFVTLFKFKWSQPNDMREF